MAGTSDVRGSGATRAPDPEDALTAAEEAHLAARHTVPIDVSRERHTDPTDVSRERHTVPIDASAQRAANRETVRLPSQRPPRSGRPERRTAPLVVAAGVATLWAALLSYAPMVLALELSQFTGGHGSVLGALRLGLAGWLLGHGVPLQTTAGPIGLAPLAVAALAAWRLMRAGVHATRGIGARGSDSAVRALTVAGAIGLGYGALGALAAWIVDAGRLGASPLAAFVRLALFAAVAALFGASKTTGALWIFSRWLPTVVRDGLRTGLVAALLLLGAGAAASGFAVALRGGEASDSLGAYRTGVTGQIGITVLCLAYAPNAAIWAAAYLVGPGFVMGAGTTIRITEVSTGALPAVPLLAGLPDHPLGWAGAALLGVPVVAGMIAGWLLARRRRAVTSTRAVVRWSILLGGAALAGPVAGIVIGLACLASGGPLGGGRLAVIGPVAWQVGAVAAGVLGLGTVIGAAVSRLVFGPKGIRPPR